VVLGKGIVFDKDDPYTGIDFDKCRDAQTGTTQPWAAALIAELSSYTELSPSGTGWHVIARARLSKERNKIGHVEMYDCGRFFTMTGQTVVGMGRSSIELRDLRSFEEPKCQLEPP
jgi:primase-polymerase (primpol)-like protein